jgi:hypothetical protein
VSMAPRFLVDADLYTIQIDSQNEHLRKTGSANNTSEHDNSADWYQGPTEFPESDRKEECVESGDTRNFGDLHRRGVP